MEGRREFAVALAGRFWLAASVAAAGGSWIELPRLEGLVCCACRLFMVFLLSLFAPGQHAAEIG
jgi:hypothetical protein